MCRRRVHGLSLLYRSLRAALGYHRRVRNLRSLAWACGWWLFAGLAMAQTRVSEVPNPRTTHAGWITDSTRQLGPIGPELEQLLTALNRDTKAEVAVAIVPSIGDETPKDFAVALFKHWSIGRRGEDDGLLVLHVLDQRRLEIETGYGLESALTDVECAWLINELAIPLFRAGNLAGGHRALLRGIDYGIRHPEATREQLLTAVGAASVAQAPLMPANASTKSAPSFEQFTEDLGPALILVMLSAGFASLLRKLAHRRQYRDPKRRPDEFSGCLASVLSLLAVGALVAGFLTELAWVAWSGVLGLGAFAGFSLRGAWRAFREGARRYAPRACGACNAKMSLVPDEQDERYLEAGQRAEERVRAADYSVWRCSCGNTSVERYADEGEYSKCQSCGYQTLKLETKEVKAATHIGSGLGERHYSCAHCNAQRVESFTIPQLTSGSSGTGSSRKSSATSSRSSGSRSRFGGGRSGGGGAGGGY
jgi:uncharacterized protein